MKCPKCGGEQHCPCPACVKRCKQKVTWKWVTDDGPIACGHCGHTMSEWDWVGEEFKQLEEKK